MLETNKNTEKILETIKNYKEKSNKELEDALNFLNNNFETTKEIIIKMTKHFDEVEMLYNKILEEYQTRNGK
jgi:prefoldin subunit 5